MCGQHNVSFGNMLRKQGRKSSKMNEQCQYFVYLSRKVSLDDTFLLLDLYI